MPLQFMACQVFRQPLAHEPKRRLVSLRATTLKPPAGEWHSCQTTRGFARAYRTFSHASRCVVAPSHTSQWQALRHRETGQTGKIFKSLRSCATNSAIRQTTAPRIRSTQLSAPRPRSETVPGNRTAETKTELHCLEVVGLSVQTITSSVPLTASKDLLGKRGCAMALTSSM